MFDHSIIELSGRSQMYALDFSAEAASGESVRQGGVLTLNANGKFVSGLGAGVLATALVAHNAPMAIFAIQGTNEFDANSDIGNMSGGVQSGLVATGGYEIQTTEFVVGIYKPNDLLTFAVGADIGKVTLSADLYSSNHVLGVVSRGSSTNADNKSVLSFWTTHMPAVNS
jgi:hypothetical protein